MGAADLTLLQITSGRGPVEVRQFVALLLDALLPELRARGLAVEAVEVQGPAEAPVSANVVLGGDAPLVDVVGTHCWVHRGAGRGRNERKRWFVGVRAFRVPAAAEPLEPAEVRYETCRARGPGGQNVNRRETAVRAIHPPTGLAARAEGQRTQHQNRADALARLAALVATHRAAARHTLQRDRRAAHDRLVRGAPVRSWRGVPLTPIP
jgi:putative peptide chain release factor H